MSGLMQDDSADQIFEELQDIVQQAILLDFPNPERKGCSGPEVLRQLANRPRPTRDAAWEHVTHCSPCYREFLDLRGLVKQQRELQRSRALRRRALVSVVAILVTGALIAGYEVIHNATGGIDLSEGRRTSRLEAGKQSAPPGFSTPERFPVFSVLLSPGQLRGQQDKQEIKDVVIPPKAAFVVLILAIEQTLYSSYDLVLESADGSDVLALSGIHARTIKDDGQAVAVACPSELLAAGDYVVRVFGVRAGQKSFSDAYSFRVRR
jgi:hypothetical protein